MSELLENIEFDFPNLGRNWACFDTETTGLCKFDSVLQLTLIDNEKNCIDEYFNTRPTIYHKKDGTTSIRRAKSWNKSQEVHHITPEMVKDKLSFYERRNEFKTIFKKYQILIGYNVKFDVNAVHNGIYHHPEWYSGIIDVLKLWKSYKEKNNITTENNKLTTVAKYLGYDFEARAHNSKEDVLATIYVLAELCKRDDEILFECMTVKKTPYPNTY